MHATRELKLDAWDFWYGGGSRGGRSHLITTSLALYMDILGENAFVIHKSNDSDT